MPTPQEVCRVKRWYDTPEEAQHALNVFSPRVADFGMRVYLCPCSRHGKPHYHIGHPNGTERPAQPKRQKRETIPFVNDQRHTWDVVH